MFAMRTDAPAPATASRTEHVQSLERGLAVIRCFGRDSSALTLSEVATSTGLSRATARRFLHTLESLGYCSTDGRTWSLRPRVLDLGYSYLTSTPMWDLVQDHLARLVQSVHESSSASVLDGDDILYTVRVPTRRIMSIALEVGTRLPAYATAMGRVLLAALDEAAFDAYLGRVTLTPITPRTVSDVETLREIIGAVRRQGYCLLDQELESGVRSIAAPIHDHDGKVVAACNVSAHASRCTLDELRKDVLAQLLETAEQIDKDLSLRR